MRDNDPFAELIRSLEDKLQGEGDWVPPDEPPRPRPQPGAPRRYLWWVIPLLLLLFFNQIISFYSDFVWYQSLGLEQVFTTRLWARLALFALGAGLFWLFVAFNVWLVRRLEPFGLERTPLQVTAAALGIQVVPLVLIAAAVIAVFVGLTTGATWESVLVYLNQHDYGLADPLFGRDVSFFLFTLPVWQILKNWLLFLLVVTLVATALVSGIAWRGWRTRRPVLLHLAILGALILVVVAWQYRLDAYQLVYSRRGVVFGAGYAAARAQLPAYNILSIVTLATGVLLVVTAVARRAWRAMVAVLVVWVAVAFLAGNVFPGLVQRFQVSPNELNLERPYIENNITFTRHGFDLGEIEVRTYEITDGLSAAGVQQESATVANVRLWDYRPLLQTYNQVQALRQYYEFNDIDVDRYVIDGTRRQVMLAARELVADRLSAEAQTWVNRRLVYTHGFGVAASPVAQVTRDGLPDFYLKDLPPQGAITVTKPQIYFGELADSYVIARTDQPEFDYPRGDMNVTTHFAADTGIDMHWGMRLLFAIHFADINLLLNQDINPDSQLLWRRNIAERVREVAPFLRYDQDPYIVIGDDGALYWTIDAYTVSSRFPYSEPLNTINYIRNPVKVVISAYDGGMRFYLMDPDEPIAAAYARIFPTLFTPGDAMPADILDNIRYPTDIFAAQAEVFRTYHMTDVDEFYNREDLWAWPQEIFGNETVAMEPYYVMMQLPGSDVLEYVQILPFTPANRENLIAWLAARSDPEVYGGKLVYEFGKDSLFFGPKQIEARIDQDPIISAQLSLWNQQGSSVIRGNLLVIPLAGSLLYVEPMYLQSASGRIPELQRVIVATGDRVEMAENLGLALVELFGRTVLGDAELADLASFGGQAAVPILAGEQMGAGADSTAGGDGLPLGMLVQQANAQFAAAQAAARAGDWAGYGAAIAELQTTLEALAQATGAVLPTPQPPAAAPSPEATAIPGS
ncbi:MAG: UPF0182 family protein [Caldilineaceae bacterium]|nr:UPF0182 family protein [Caldilineaceae bacterium]